MKDNTLAIGKFYKREQGMSPAAILTLAKPLSVSNTGFISCETIKFNENDHSIKTVNEELTDTEGFIEIAQAEYAMVKDYLKRHSDKMLSFLKTNLFKSIDPMKFKVSGGAGHEKALYCQKESRFSPYKIGYVNGIVNDRFGLRYEMDYISISDDAREFQTDRGVLMNHPFIVYPNRDDYVFQLQDTDIAKLETMSDFPFITIMKSFGVKGYTPDDMKYDFMRRSFKRETFNRFSENHEPISREYLYVSCLDDKDEETFEVVYMLSMKNGDEYKNYWSQIHRVKIDELKEMIHGMQKCTVREFLCCMRMIMKYFESTFMYLSSELKRGEEVESLEVGKYYLLTMDKDGLEEYTCARVTDVSDDYYGMQYESASCYSSERADSYILKGFKKGKLGKSEIGKGKVYEVKGDDINFYKLALYEACYNDIATEYRRPRNIELEKKMEEVIYA